MASNMTKAFQNKSRRALGCRPGYAGGGSTDVYRTGSNSFGDQGAQLMPQGAGGSGVVNAGAPLPAATPSVSPSPSGPLDYSSGISRGPMKADGVSPIGAYADTMQGRIAADRDRMLQGGMSEATYQQFYSPDARMQQDAAAKVQQKLGMMSMSERDMLAGHNPNGPYKVNRGGNKVYGFETPDSRSLMHSQGVRSLGFGANQSMPGTSPEMQAALNRQAALQLGGYADGGAVVKEDPVEALLKRMKQNYGTTTSVPAPQPAPAPTPAPTTAPPPQSDPRRTPLDSIRQRDAELKRITNYSDGGTVRQVEFHGPGGPREDKIPVRFAGADIRVSDGERGVILPAKTAANPYAVDAIEDIIQETNDGRAPRRALGDGGRYADSNLIGPAEVLKAKNAALYALPVERLPDAPDGPKPVSAEEAFARARSKLGQPTPQNIAPDLQIPPEPAAAQAAEPAPKKGLVSRTLGDGVDKVKSMFHRTPVTDTTIQTSAKTQNAAEAAAEARRAATTYKVENPTPDPKPSFRAKLNGASSTNVEDVGRAVYRGAKKVLPSPAGAIQATAVGAGLEGAVRGLNTDTSEYAQRLGVNEPTSVLGATALRTAGVLSDVGASVINAGALPYNVIEHGIDTKAAGEAWDKAQNRYGFEKPLAALGGATKDWWDYRNNFDDVRAAHAGAAPAAPTLNATERAQALGKIQQADYSNEGRYSNADRFTPADLQRQRELTQHTGNAGNVGSEAGGNRIRWQATRGYDPTTQVFEPGTGVATVTGAAVNGGRMMPGVKRNALGASIAMGPGNYLAKDGSRTADWYKTQDYEDAIRRNAQMQVALSQIQNERAGRDPMASRVLGQQLLPPGATAATGATSSDELMQQALKNLASSDPGTRALGQHQLAAQNQMISQQMARAKMGYEMRKDQAAMSNADKAAARSDAEAFDKHLATIFRTKGGKDGNEDVPDTDAIAEFKRMAAYTTKANLEEALTQEQKARWVSALTGKARDVAELDAADHAKMIQQFKVRQRALQTAGLWPGDTDLGDSQRLDHWTPHITSDGNEVYFPKLLKDGRPLRGKTKQFAYTRPIGLWNLQATATPTNDILADAIRDK